MQLRLTSSGSVLLLGTVLVSLSIIVYVFATITAPYTRLIRIEQLFALSALLTLYTYFLIPPLYVVFPQLPTRTKIIGIREYLLVATWYFGFIHTLLVFFGQLGGFAGLPFLSATYLFAISLSFTALIILSWFLVIFVRKILSKNRKIGKIISYFITLTGFLILVHALLVGTHFVDVSQLIPQLLLVALGFLFLLQARVIDTWLAKKRDIRPPVGIAFSTTTVLFLLYILSGLLLPSSPFSVGIHAEHLASLKKKGNTIPQQSLFSAAFTHPDSVQPNASTLLHFLVQTRSDRKAVTEFTTVNEKYIHLIIVDSSLTYFNHLHPDKNQNAFSVTTSFPRSTTYYLFSEFQPLNAPEQVFRFTLPVGTDIDTPVVMPRADSSLTKQFGKYSVTLSMPPLLKASELNVGQTKFSYTIRNASDNAPVTTLKPYLGSFGHMVMISEKNYSYYHVHPVNTSPPKETDDGGPTVSFYPLALYQKFTPGIYRIFAQFNPNGELFTADFTVEIQ